MSISFSGLASGLDTSSWVEQLTALKRAKVTTLQQEKTEAANVKDALANIKSFFTSFRSKLEKVTDSKLFSGTSMDVFTKKLAASSNTDVITATATSSAKEGTYTVEVEKLATATEAKSRYATTYDKIKTANLDSKLTSLGMNLAAEGSQITISKNGVESTITLNNTDTIATLLNKFKSVGVEGSFNEKTGAISLNIAKSDIIDTGFTNIKTALHLDNVQSGYETGALTTTKVENVVNPADRDTRLSELGITTFAGKIFGATFSGGYQELSFEDAEDNTKSITLGNLIDFINANGGNASIDEDGVLEVSGLALSNDFSIDVFDALGLSPTVTETSQTSKALKLTVEDTVGEAITGETTLGQIFDFGEDESRTVVVNGTTEKTFTSGMTVDDFLDELEDAGLTTNLAADGTITLSGGEITGGTLNLSPLELTQTPNSASVTSAVLTEEVTTEHIATLDTTLGELGITQGYIKVKSGDDYVTTSEPLNDPNRTLQTFFNILNVLSGQINAMNYTADQYTDPNSSSNIYFDTQTGTVTFKNADFLSVDLDDPEMVATNALDVLFGANLEDNTNIVSSSLTSEKLYYTEVGSEAATTDTLLSKYYNLGEGEHFSFTLYDRHGDLVEWDYSPEATQLITMDDDATIGDLIDVINEKADIVGTSCSASFTNGKIIFYGSIEANGNFAENAGLTTAITAVTDTVYNISKVQVIRGIEASDELSLITGINPNNDFVSGLQRITDADQITAEGWTTVSTAQDFADAISGGASKILLTGNINFNGFNDYNTAASDVTINGNGYTISNLTKGLFSTLEDAEVYNLKLTGTMSATDSTGDGFLADVATGTINVHNVSVNGTINTSNNSEIAGLVFGIVNNSATLTLDDIKTSGRVGSTQANVEDHTEVTGGVIGQTSCDSLINITDTITDAAVYGNIAGGIIGEMCFSKADNTSRAVVDGCMATFTDYEANRYNAIIGQVTTDIPADYSEYVDWVIGSKSGHISNNYYGASGTNKVSLYNNGVYFDDQYYGSFTMAEAPGLSLNTGFIVMDENDDAVAAIDTSACTTLSDLLGTLDSYGFEYSITDGVINISNTTNNYYLADTPLTESLGLITNSATATSTSARMTKEVTNDIYTRTNLLSEIGVTGGTLEVTTHLGTSTITIDPSDTIYDFTQALEGIGLTVSHLSSLISISDSVTTQGEAQITFNEIGTNIIEVLGFDGNNEDIDYMHQIRNQTRSDELYYPTYTTMDATGNTKLVDITGFGNSEVNDFTLEAGYYHVFTPDGVQHTEEITDTTTINDFLATLRGYGFDATISAQGKISVESTGNAYIAESNYVDNNSNIADLLNLTQNRNIVSDPLGYSTTNDENITRATKLSNITNTYQDGYITVVNPDGTRTNVNLDVNETVGSFMDKLTDRGFDVALTDGVISIASEGARVVDYTGMGQASNALNILGISPSEWEIDNSYVSKAMHVIDPENSTYEVAADRNTALSDLGVTTGEYNIYNNGVKYTAYISSDETLGSFVDTLKSFGLSVGVFDEGNQSIVKVTGNGNSYLETSANPSASNVVTALFNSPEATNAYSGTLETENEETTHPLATSETLIGELAGAWGETVAGNLVVNVNDVESTISIANEDSIGSVLDRLRQLGVEATIADGKITVQGGLNTFSIDTSKSTSSLANPSAATGLIRNEELDDYVSSTEEILSTTRETKNISVANWADMSTKLGLLNITSGSLSVYKDGTKAVVHVDSSQTFQDLEDAINTEFGGDDIELRFDDGLLKICSQSEAQVDVGSAIDTSNFASITGIQKDENGIVSSARELYKVNSSSVITQSGLFRQGDVFAGSFVVGDATITIDDRTTIADLVNQINNSADANANAYWDNITGNLVITSKTTGSSYINIEISNDRGRNCTNFTDIMGYTESRWLVTYDDQGGGSGGRNGNIRPGSGVGFDEGASSTVLNTTRMLAENQTLGSNAKFKINGTSYTSTTNTISSDVSRIEGVTINLKGISKDEPVEITIANDKEKVADSVEEVITAYNELMENVDKELASAGNLNSESTLKMIRNQLRTLMTGTEAGMAKFLNLDSIGIGVSKATAGNISTGNSNVINLSFDRDKFTSAFESDPTELKKLLLGEDGNDSAGIFNRVESVLDNALKSVNGYFDIATKTQTDKITNINQKITKQNQYIERYRQQLQNKFKTMDMLISQMNERYRNLLSA